MPSFLIILCYFVEAGGTGVKRWLNNISASLGKNFLNHIMRCFPKIHLVYAYSVHSMTCVVICH